MVKGRYQEINLASYSYRQMVRARGRDEFSLTNDVTHARWDSQASKIDAARAALQVLHENTLCMRVL